MTDKGYMKISKITMIVVLISELIWLGIDLFFYRSSEWIIPFSIFTVQVAVIYGLAYKGKHSHKGSHEG
ncbi:hypothetical protein [Convivina intestini]|uniref:hypothetical protein n=1 Tax=Convivina intestini TaxID=1505726 RepID=UPI00200EBE0A|nr:hypothetical protein [Convivina intestini]CAH1850974.1 hypothetical protein R078131_00200 [Convivina intestini]